VGGWNHGCSAASKMLYKVQYETVGFSGWVYADPHRFEREHTTSISPVENFSADGVPGV